MGGGLMQLVAYGAQDIYLTGNPQITFFKVVYRRHTNFAVEAIEQTFNGAAAFGQKFSCTISRNGDLLSRVYLEMDLDIKLNYDDPTTDADHVGVDAYVNMGFDMIDHVEVEIGGQCIDKHYGEWMGIWTHLTHDNDKLDMLKKLVDTDRLEAVTAGTGAAPGAGSTVDAGKKLYVPLQFWFCRNPGLALPLIALQYHEVKVNVSFGSRPQLKNDAATNFATYTKGNTTAQQLNQYEISNCCVFCDYVFLDTDERRRFAQVSHEYLIEQVQYSNALSQGSGQDQHELRFNHPVKELVWTVHKSTNAPFNYFNTENGTEQDMVKTALLQLNGHDRMKKREGSYFRCVQPFQHHTGGHQQDDGSANSDPLGGMYCYSFGLKPEEHQPSGTCNFSRIDNAVLALDTQDAGTLKVYAVNYNVLRIMSGMGGLAYSN